MKSSVERVLGIYELLERIILQLNCIEEIIQAQRVCRNWRDVVQTSPVLHEACWYRRPHDMETYTRDQPASGQRQTLRKLNPVFNRIGISVQPDPGRCPKREEYGDFNLKECIYDKPGSWTTTLASQPPCLRIMVECFGDYSADENMIYLIESTTGCPLLLGDVMTILAECQNRQQCGVDRWAGVQHFTGAVYPDSADPEWGLPDLWPALDKMRDEGDEDDVSINVAVELPFGTGEYPAFALRRLHPPAELGEGSSHCYPAAGSRGFLHELILHKMIHNGIEYSWDGGRRQSPVCKTGEYEANLLAAKKRYEGFYLPLTT